MYGNDKKYYAVKYVNDGRFSFKALKEQGVKTVVEERKEKEEKEKTPIEKATEVVSDVVNTILIANWLKLVYVLPLVLKYET